ncbi:MAG: hypothetical protein M9931_10685 [Chitinophagales bacterium]|nr:hypothetical protein [Chitinophagales bacterium]
METQKLPKEFKSFIETLLSDEANVFWEALNESSPVSIRQNSKKKEKHWQQATEIEWCKSGKSILVKDHFLPPTHIFMQAATMCRRPHQCF